jgi:predicted O-methyltransferase YrrM
MNSIKQSLRTAAYAVAPRYVIDKYINHRMVREARSLSRLRDSCRDDLSVLIEMLWRSHFFRPLQRRSEILRLVELIRSFQPATVCEIGAAGGGTTFLMAFAASSDATIISLDLNFPQVRKTAIGSFARDEQKIICLEEDSHRPKAVQALKESLPGKSLDILYLDGDHSYEGVKADFQTFSPLVRPGGLIIFHDIVPDYKTRYGIETPSYVGGVPQFWEEIKTSYATIEEIVEDFGQDGFGIGVLSLSDSAA